MATPDDLITLPRLRDALGIPGDEADAVLTGYRAAAVDWLEGWLGRQILDRSNLTSAADAFGWLDEPDALYFGLADVKADSSVTLHFADFDADPGAGRSGTQVFASTDGLLSIDAKGVLIYRAAAEAKRWNRSIRFAHPTPTISAEVGMSAGDIPAQWSEAAALIVRALYDGSAFDSLGEMSVLTMMLQSYRPVLSTPEL